MRSLEGLHERGNALFTRLWESLISINGVRCYGPPPHRPRTPTVSFTIAGVSSADAAKALAQEGVFVSNGNFYATGVVNAIGNPPGGLVRAGCACYTSEEEVDRLIAGVERLSK